MRGLPDNNADGAEETIPYTYLDFWRRVEKKSFEFNFDKSFEKCIVLVQF